MISNLLETIDLMKNKKIAFTHGLSDAEIRSVELQFGFRFPSDLRKFLQIAMPVGKQFPDWRTSDESILRNWLASPLEGISHCIG